MKLKKTLSLLLVLVLAISMLCGCQIETVNGVLDEILPTQETISTSNEISNNTETKLLASEYDGEPFAVINNNIPFFSEEDKKSTVAFETYSELDDLGRCGVAYANICKELMPTEKRESLSSVTPSGWKNKKYDFVDGGWVYNRAHIIGFQLAGEQANELNLITGTRYFNVDGMLTFENMVADYVKEDGGHVLYRVTPVYEGNNLVAEGVIMEGWSVEDSGESICFNVFCYNVQPGVEIDYKTGDNWLKEENRESNDITENNIIYILNINSKKFHKENCNSVSNISEKNKRVQKDNRENLLKQGYEPCGSCKP